jgi:hypothetical protein
MLKRVLKRQVAPPMFGSMGLLIEVIASRAACHGRTNVKHRDATPRATILSENE